METIDSHQHYWRPARGDYGWIPENDPTLNRAYGPEDLAPYLAATGVSRTVLVQAAPTVAETEFLLDLSDETASVAAVVGWVDFEKDNARRMLGRFALNGKFAGVRPMIQDIDDDLWMLRKEFDETFRALVDFDLTFDALALPRHIEPLLTLLKRHPGLRVVLDHCLKPNIGGHDASFREWADGMTRLAEDTGAYVKLSGLVTEAPANWSASMLQPYVDHVVGAFGAPRVMWGSDWPVVRLRCEYERWFKTAHGLTAGLPNKDRGMVFGGAAMAFYRISERRETYP